jgi:glycosyltransferase involved in cell wall biosynthesis
MNCLWLTLADPEPRHNGQFVYSGGLIDALAGADVDVVALGLARGERVPVQGAVEGRTRWVLAPHQPRSRWASLASSLPHIADRCRTREMARLFDVLLYGHRWDSIVFDGISVGWALKPVLARFRDAATRPRLVYVSHNHEESLRAQIAGNQSHTLKRHVMQLEAMKVTRLERALVDAVDLVTAITPEDRALYLRRRPDKRIDVLTPGYHGRRVAGRRLTADLPRRAVIVGSFDWVAKRLNLEEFVGIADPLFAAQSAELQVVGSAEPAFLDRLRRQVTATEFTGTVDCVTPHLDRARIAVVPERSGGGFKLKVLDYVFNRMPILALDGSVAGMPLRPNESVILCPDHHALALAVLRAMDDLELLNRLQDVAYRICRDNFDWAARGHHLRTAIAGLMTREHAA